MRVDEVESGKYKAIECLSMVAHRQVMDMAELLGPTILAASSWQWNHSRISHVQKLSKLSQHPNVQ